METPPYNYGNFPTAIGVPATSQQLFTAYQFVQDNPQYRRQLMERHGMKKNFFAMLKELGLGTPLAGPELGHFERDWVKNNFVIASVVTAPGGAGEPGVYALSAGSMYTTTLPGVGSVGFSYPSKWDIVYLPNGKRAQIINKDTTVSPHQITLQPANVADTLVGAITPGARYWIGDNALPEGSGSVEVKQPRYFKWVNNTQIIKSRFAETGTSLTNQLPFKSIEGREGAFIVMGTTDTERLQMERLSKALFFGDKSDNLTGMSDALGHNVPNKTTQGLDKFIENEGGTVLPVTQGALDMDDFDVIGEVQSRERITSNTFLMPMAFLMQAEYNTLLKDYMDNNCFQYASKAFPSNSYFSAADANDHFLWLDFTGIHKNGKNYLFKNLAELDEQVGAGTEGYGYSYSGYVLPVESFQNKGGNNPLRPTLGYEYKALNGYSREFEMYNHGGAGPIQKTSEIDAMNLEFRSEIGGHWGLANHMIKLKSA